MKHFVKKFLPITCIFVFLMFFLCTKTNASPTSPQIFSFQKPYNDDINFLKYSLPKYHPDLFFKHNKKQYYDKLNYLSMNQYKYYKNDMRFEIMTLIASAGDGHTFAYVKSEKFYPFVAKWFDDDSLRITAVPEKYKFILGYKIVSVNNIPIDTVINKLNLITPCESKSWQKSKSAKNICNYELLKVLNIVNNDDLSLTLNDFSDKRVAVHFKPIEKNKINKTKFLDLLHYSKNIPRPLYISNKNYYHAYDKKNKIFYFKYKSCNSKNDINKYFDKLVDDFNKTDSKKFIIDLRDNTGGNPKLIHYLINKLSSDSKFKNISSKSNTVFIFTNSSTFSAGVFAAADFKKSFVNAKIVGTDTGGCKSVFSNPKTKHLEQCDLYISYATDKYSEDYKFSREPLKPDLVCGLSLKDALSNIDSNYNLVKDLPIY